MQSVLANAIIHQEQDIEKNAVLVCDQRDSFTPLAYSFYHETSCKLQEKISVQNSLLLGPNHSMHFSL